MGIKPRNLIRHLKEIHFVCPSKVCMSIVLFPLGIYNVPKRNWKQCLCKILEGQTKSIMVFLILANSPFCRYGDHFDFYCFERHYGMLRGQINMYLPSGHPIIAIRNNRNQNGRRIGKKVYRPCSYFSVMDWN